ncbi:MAG: ABC transporter substrate-binding protein [Burkholderiales bacterium RIFCSPLOWO2_02_FULL_57_36]|nr:MAG: ABC transporter substrate-binding protein [Burkholderiales bacterium RIFCSPLOWO2_02_FULL_57_36]
MKIKPIENAFAFLALMFTAGAIAQNNNPTVKIGEINSYSTAPEFTVPYRKGWQLAVDEINAAGGIEGRKIEVFSRDDGNDRNEAAQVARSLISREKVDVLAGTYLSNTGLAVSAVAAKNKKLFIAAGPLSDAITLDRGNRYTFRLRPSTYMQAAMLAEEAAKLPARRWAMLAPNYEYGQSAVANFKSMLKARRPDIEFVAEQWPALNKIDAATVVQRLEKARPDAIFNATFGADLDKFVHEGKRRGLFGKVMVASMLGGEPENLKILKDATPKGWIVTGYPANQIDTPAHARFAHAYFEKYNDHPQIGSVIGYTMILAIAEGVRKAQSTDSEKLVTAMRGFQFATPMGPAVFRAIDQQATLGTYVGILDQKNGNGFMTNWRYADGAKYLPDEAYVRRRRPASAIK